VPYITCPGKKVRTLVSHLGVFEKLEGEEEFFLTGLFPGPEGSGKEQALRRIQDQCGWELKAARDLGWIDPPDLNELRLLRIFDPRRLYLGKI
jgi:acyl CoA:acetate/3-ketoacid CoA transferase beta subunit